MPAVAELFLALLPQCTGNSTHPAWAYWLYTDEASAWTAFSQALQARPVHLPRPARIELIVLDHPTAVAVLVDTARQRGVFVQSDGVVAPVNALQPDTPD